MMVESHASRPLLYLVILFFCDLTISDSPPKVTDPTNAYTTVYVVELPVTVPCNATGYPRPTVRWYRQGKLIKNGLNFDTTPDGGLKVKNFNTSQDGYFQCKATNLWGTSLSDLVYIKNMRIQTPLLEQEITVVENSPLSHECAYPPELKIRTQMFYRSWYRDNRIVIGTDNGRIGMDTKGTLYFAYTKNEDSNTYICALTSDGSLETAITIKRIVLIVTPDTSQTTRDPPIRGY